MPTLELCRFCSNPTQTEITNIEIPRLGCNITFDKRVSCPVCNWVSESKTVNNEKIYSLEVDGVLIDRDVFSFINKICGNNTMNLLKTLIQKWNQVPKSESGIMSEYEQFQKDIR